MIKLVLPVPPSPNSKLSHPMQAHRAKRAYQWTTWIRAVSQHTPKLDPPAKVRIDARFFYRAHPRDADNLIGSLKWTIDALRQKQANPDWRRGLADRCGYFVDDSPAHMEIGEVVQEKGIGQRLVLMITPIPEDPQAE